MPRSPAKKAYHRRYMRERYQNDPEFRRRHRERTDRNDRRARAEVAELLATFRACGCLLCPERHAACLAAHHINPDTKRFDIANGIRQKYSRRRIAAELEKCVCLCMNCHSKVHAGVVMLPGHV